MQIDRDLFRKYHFLIALLLIMAVFVPVNSFSFLNFDDNVILMKLHESFSSLSWKTIFLRSSSTKYYRPLLTILNHMDYTLWGTSVGAFHLTNYIIHILNACLVYFIVIRFWPQKKNVQYWAAVAMLLFALNPMTCESVAWISGRSDLAGTFFSLLAVCFYFMKSKLRFFLTPVAILAGLLCKENALSIVPIIVLLDFYINYRDKKSTHEKIRSWIVWSIVVFIPLAIYFFLRTNGWEHYTYKYVDVANMTGKLTADNLNSVNTVVSGSIDFSHLLFVFPVTAFYLKKLIVPFPLNFAITQINITFYSLLFLAFSGIFMFFVVKKQIPVLLFLIVIVLSFVPAIPVALGGVSWVPMAERYLYLSLSITALGAVSIMMYFHENKILEIRTIIYIGTILVMVLSASTFFRVFVFKDDRSLWTKTYQTNSESGMVLMKYARAVGGEEGQRAFRRAVSIPSFLTWRAEALLNIAQYEIKHGRIEEGVDKIEEALTIKNDVKINTFAAFLLANIDEKDSIRKKEYLEKAIACLETILKKKNSVVVEYTMATYLKAIDRRDEAVKIFNEIITKYPESRYATYAKKQMSH